MLGILRLDTEYFGGDIAHGGSYSIYYALAVASKEIQLDHR
jgi:hypothetical protein